MSTSAARTISPPTATVAILALAISCEYPFLAPIADAMAEYTEAATKGYGALYEANKGLKKGFNPLTMSPKIYELLKWGVLIFLPASGTLYLALSKFWGLPYGQEIVATIAAISAFLGIFLGVSSAKYNKFLNGE